MIRIASSSAHFQPSPGAFGLYEYTGFVHYTTLHHTTALSIIHTEREALFTTTKRDPRY